MAANMAAHVAATPAGVKRIRLAIGTSGGTEAGAGMRASSTRVAHGWVVGGRVAAARNTVVTRRPASL